MFKELNKNKIMFLMLLFILIFFFINLYFLMVGIYYVFIWYDFEGGLFGSLFVGLENFKFFWQFGMLLKFMINMVGYNFVFIILGNGFVIFCVIMLSEVCGKFFKKIM